MVLDNESSNFASFLHLRGMYQIKYESLATYELSKKHRTVLCPRPFLSCNSYQITKRLSVKNRSNLFSFTLLR